MKFMVQWTLIAGNRHEAIRNFSQMTLDQELGEHGSKMNFIGRWHDLAGFTGVAIIETDDIKAINGWLVNWADVCEINVTPVVDDEETKQAVNMLA